MSDWWIERSRTFLSIRLSFARYLEETYFAD
jgi:hypothetical protein